MIVHKENAGADELVCHKCPAYLSILQGVAIYAVIWGRGPLQLKGGWGATPQKDGPLHLVRGGRGLFTHTVASTLTVTGQHLHVAWEVQL